MKCLVGVFCSVLFLSGCSDDVTPHADSAIQDIGADSVAVDSVLVDAPKADSAKPDVAMPDAAMPDAAKPDVAMPDAAKPDAINKDLSLATDTTISGCQKLISLCSGSSVWKAYVSPFTVSQCIKNMNCVLNLYSGKCLTQFQALVSCVAGISSSSACNTSCMTYLTYLTTNCVCPSACGITCP